MCTPRRAAPPSIIRPRGAEATRGARDKSIDKRPALVGQNGGRVKSEVGTVLSVSSPSSRKLRPSRNLSICPDRGITGQVDMFPHSDLTRSRPATAAMMI